MCHHRTMCLAMCGALLALTMLACAKKEQEPQKTAPPAATIPDTLVSAPEDTMPLVDEIKPQVVSSPDGKYTVQVSSWQTRQKAERIAQQFRDRGYDAYVQSAYLSDRRETWYRVRVGRYATSNDATQVASEIRDLLESGYWIDRVRQPNANE